MSAISGFINTIRNAVYGEQVRGAIISALEACYSDVNSPSLNTEAFETALNEAYAGGILDIQTVTSFSAMTNQKIIYRYNGTAAGKQKGLYYFSDLSDSWVLIGSEIQKVSLLSQMTDTNDIYKYIGTESGMVQNSLYCYNGTDWVPIGSGVLTAANSAQMVNVGAIYKYTGTETGFYTNALYYFNGTDWVPLATKEEALTNDIKLAIIDCFNNVAWTDENGKSRVEALAYAMGVSSAPLLYMAIGDIAAATGEVNTAELRRIYTQTSISVQNETVTISGCPFADSWNEWSGGYGGFGVRCYDANGDYIGATTPGTSSGLYGSDVNTIPLLTGTKSIRLIMQKGNVNFNANFINTMINPLYIDNVGYRFAKGAS